MAQAAMFNKKYKEGTPTLAEWPGLWRHSEKDPKANIEECREATDSLWSHLERIYRVGSGDWEDIFLKGDFLGDRSQVIEIVYPPAITPQLFQQLSSWISAQSNPWRVIVPTFLGNKDAFIVYPEGVRYRSEFGIPSDDLCRRIASEMLGLSGFSHCQERASEEKFL
jgi:hypothetical protein